MADVITLNERTLGGGRIIDSVSGQVLPAIWGKGNLPARTRTFTSGTGNNQVDKFHLSQRTLTATTFDLLDLSGVLTDYKGVAITFSKIKRVYIAIVSPDGTKSLRIGPQNQANAGQFGWGGTGATVYQTIYTDWDDYFPYAGHTVTAGTGDIYPVYNPGASSVTYALLIAGLD